jgi:CheY-like chemotaxis protein
MPVRDRRRPHRRAAAIRRAPGRVAPRRPPARDPRSRRKDELLEALAHELRTRLTAMLGWLQLLRNEALDAERSEHAIEVVHRNADAQVRLIEEALDASRIAAGGLRISREPVRPGPLLESAVESIAHEARRKQIVFEKDIPQDLPVLDASPRRLRQIVGHVLDNAVKFTSRGGHVRVRVTARRGRVRIEVRDDGMGIPPESLPHVFDGLRGGTGRVARRAPGGAAPPEPGGLGLGLAITRHLVQAHRGTIRLASRGPGKGTVVTIDLPAPRGAVAGGATVDRAADASLPILKDVTALVVDDHEDSGEVLAALLERRGAEVLRAADAGTAFETLARSRPDLLIADLAMPGMDGAELIRRVRNGGSAIPAIALSARARPRDRMRALRAGFDAYCTKPVDANELYRVIASLPGVR